MGYLKKSGDIAVSGVDTAYSSAKLKTGLVGVQVRIMPSTTRMPDDIIYLDKVQVTDMSTGKVEVIKADAKDTKDDSANADKDKKSKKSKSKDSSKEKDSEKKSAKKKPAKKKEESEPVEKDKSG